MYKPDNVLDEYQKALRASIDAYQGWRQGALEDFQLYGGNQWRKEDVDNLRGTGRGAVTFNKVTGIVNAVCGSEVTNRFETRFIPRTAEDEFFNEIMTETVRYIRQRSDVEHEESAAFMDASICGLGCTEFWKDYTEDPEGIDKVDHVNILDVLPDPGAVKMNLSDGGYVIRGKWMDLQSAKLRWPGSKAALEALASATDGSAYPDKAQGSVHDQSEAFKYDNSQMAFYTPATQKVLIHEYQRWYLEKRIYFVDQVSGQEGVMDASGWEAQKKKFAQMGLVEGQDFTGTEIHQKVYWRGFFCHNIVLEDELSPLQSGFTYKFITGFREVREDRIMWFGLCKLMRDPQRWINKSMSQIIYMMSTNPKGAILAEKGIFINPTQAMNDWSMPNKIIDMQPGAVANKQFMIAKGDYPTGLDRIMQLSAEYVSQAVGVNPYFLGSVDDLKRTAGSAVSSVQQQALVVLSVLFDGLKKYRKEAGRMHLEFIEKFMPEGTIIRVALPNMGGTPMMIPFKQEWATTVKYDVIVDSAPVSHNAIREFWSSLQQTQSLELLMNVGIMTPDIIADTVPDVPTTIRERMKQNAMKQDLLNQAMQMLQAGDEQGVIQMLYQLMEQQGGQGQV